LWGSHSQVLNGTCPTLALVCRRLRFALWKARRIQVGRTFRNANRDITIIGNPIEL
jgi:hypothetical protein